jgi:Ala-tRNA(Pro) deacylase
VTQLSVLQAIRQLLSAANIPFRKVRHEPTYTSADSARARGEELRTGGKALLMKVDGEFGLFIIPADRKADSASIRRELNRRKLRFATTEELQSLTGLVPGSVPPFGRPILPFDLYVDAALCENERIAFNAGSLTDSMILDVDDYLRVASPVRIFAFSVPVDG